ncbi:MAG: HAMP domain-containing histidine kinase [Patescibacteria group bacterium]|nr:HAMP domain-containing histidine kinase [Patescibacteria group bacterium]MCL5431636.1 HAMP domain-containing histidine kinase [Patescibacteria group bacterium]
MFNAARIKLTAWYLLIIMLISVIFSAVIFLGATRELGRFERAAVLHRVRASSDEEFLILIPTPPQGLPALDPAIVDQARARLILALVLINLGILAVSGAAGYFLAGKTLEPIAAMMEEQSRFVADASHELHTPLTALKTATEVTLRDKALTLKGAKQSLKENLEEVNSLQSLSDSLLRLTKLKESTGNFQTVSLVEVLTAAQKKVAALADQKHIKINADYKNYFILADKDSLTELFVTLLDNAIKYSNNNTVVRLTAGKTDHHVAVAVADQGVGIAQEDLPHIFDRFFRADKSRTGNRAHGYGLGLSIAKKIAQAHNGTIEVKSAFNQGATFTVKLPVII